MLTKEDIREIGKLFGSEKMINEGSLDFALSAAKHSKDWVRQLAYIIRAILIDHVFHNGNKRVSSALIISTLEEKKIAYDPYAVDRMIILILKNNIIDIEKIRRMIKDVTR